MGNSPPSNTNNEICAMENSTTPMESGQEFSLALPHELSEKILQYLPPQDLSRFSMCCRHYWELSNSDHLWIHHCIVRGWLRYGISPSILNREPLYVKETNVSGKSPLFELYVPAETRLSPLCKWKHIFLRMMQLQKNWTYGRYTVSPILRGHKEKVTAMDASGYTLVSGSLDHQLKVWNIRTCECLCTISVHTDTVSAVRLKGNYVITGCGDSTVRVLDIHSGHVCLTFQGHTGSVDHIELIDHLIITAGSDRTIRIWSLIEQQLLHTFRGHDDDIECIAVHGRHVLSGSWDKTLMLWDVDTGTLQHRFEGHTEAITALQFDENITVSGSADGDVRVWSTSAGQCTRVLAGSRDAEVYCVVYNNEVIASGSSDSIVRIWNHGGELLHSLTEHLGVVRCLHINRERLVSGGDQKKIVVWDYRLGKKLHVAHRHPTRLQRMIVEDTHIITASPDTPGTMAVLSYW